MVAFMVYQIVCLLIVIHATCGLLSDYKICGDAECESRMSRVQAIQDHYSRDCRFLSFRQGDMIFVYHKLTGKKEDLWAGSIDRNFGYFPKNAVKEEERFATTEQVLKTQRSDFFCIDENGYPIDPSELEDNANDIYLPETTEAVSNTWESSLQESHHASAKTKRINGQEEASKEDETFHEQAESIPKEDKKEEIGESSLASSAIEWLGFGAKHNGKHTQETKVQDTEALETSVTNWLGFGSNSKVYEKIQEDHGKRIQDDKSTEVFKGRKIALDLQEDNQFNPEEIQESGTLDWIGNEISSTLGFGLNTKETKQENAVEELETESKPVSSSWFDVSITDMLGFRRGLAEGNGEKQKDLPSADPDTPNFASSDQPKLVDVETVQTEAKTNINTSLNAESSDKNNHNNSESFNDVQINASSDSDPEIKLEHREGNLQTSEGSSTENKLLQISCETDRLKETDDAAAFLAHTGSSQGSHVIHARDYQDFLLQDSLEQNTTEANTDLQTENAPNKLTENGLELEMPKAELQSYRERVDYLDNLEVSETENLQSSMGQAIEVKSGGKNQEETGSKIEENDIQEEANKNKDMSEEIVETNQDVVGKQRPKGELKDDGFGKTEKILDNLDEIMEITNAQDATDVEIEEHETKLDARYYEEVSEGEYGEAMMIHEENSQEFVEGIGLIDEKSNSFDEKDNSQQLVKEDIGIKKKVDSIEDTKDIISKNVQESTSLKEIEPNPKDTEQNVYEGIDHSLIEIRKTSQHSDQIVENSNVIEGNSEKKEVNIKSSEYNTDLNTIRNKMAENEHRTGVYNSEEEIDVTASQNVLNDTAINGPSKPTASLDITDEIQRENGKVSGLFNNRSQLFKYSANSETTGLNVETATKEPQVNIMITEDTELKNNAKDIPNIQKIAPSTQFPSVQSTNVPTLNLKTLHKRYHNILNFMSTNELGILIDHFGEHKMQFLDYILGSLETATGEYDADISILLDIDRLLNYHMERLATDMRGNYAPEEDKDKILMAMQKVEVVVEKVKVEFNIIKADGKEQEQSIWISKDKENNNKENMEKMHYMKDLETEKDQRHTKGGTDPILDFLNKTSVDAMKQIYAAVEVFIWLTMQVVSALPEDIRPGPDLYGVPWEPVIISGLVGLVTVLVFVCRCYNSVKSRMYQSKERWMAEQVAQLLDEKCKVLETLSKVQQEYNGVENSLRDSGVLAQTQKTIHLEAKAKQLERQKKEFEGDLGSLKDQLKQQREHRLEQEQRILALEESTSKSEEETKMFQSQEEQGQTTLKVYSMNSDRLQRNLETAGEENALLQENNNHLRQQLDGWAERVSELEEEMRRCEHSHSGMLQDVATKDERIMSLTDRLLQMKAWDSDLEGEQGFEAERETSNGTARSGETNGSGTVTDSQGHFQKVQKLIHAAKLNADLKSVDEDKDRIFAKLNDEVKAKDDLQGSIKDLENEKLSLQSETMHYTDQVQVLQQKLQIMTEMYQENELKLHRLLTVEEKERLQKEEKLTKADKNIAMAMEELNNYRQRAEEMEEELEKTKQSYQTQISSHEKKAHNNWLAARSAERDLAEIRRENALLRQKLTDTQFKLEAIEKDPYALDSLARPLPFRGRPASETRAFLSPPTLMDGPPNRLSPRVVMRGSLEPPVGPGDMERTGGPHSDSGSISPIWERDRRGPPSGPLPGCPPGPLSGPLPGIPGMMPPPGYIFSEAGGPVYRRPPPGPMGLHPAPGPLPPRGNRPPGPPADMADGPYRENSLGPGEHDHREPGNVERRTPPEAELRVGGMPPPGPMLGPVDGPFPRRAPYGPPPPEYFHPRMPGGPPVPVWGPPPPGMMYPPRFPPGGPLPPQMSPYSGPPLRPPMSDGHPPPSLGPPQPPLIVPTQRQSSEEHTPSPQDII